MWSFIPGRSGGYNKTGIALSLLALLEFATRPASNILAAEPSGRTSSANTVPKGDKAKAPTVSASNAKPSSNHWLTAAIPLGSLVFTLHNMISDSSTLIAWSWTGYTNGKPNGPLPHLHGSFTLLAQCLGLLIPISLSSYGDAGVDGNILAHPLWFLVGCGSSFVVYQYRNWVGYSGGLALAVFLMSITPLVMQRATLTGKVARTYTTAFFVAIVLNLASIFTVAYAFVPGGNIVRERTDV